MAVTEQNNQSNSNAMWMHNILRDPGEREIEAPVVFVRGIFTQFYEIKEQESNPISTCGHPADRAEFDRHVETHLLS
jgi:hypothetical protein